MLVDSNELQHWNWNVVISIKFLSLAAPKVVNNYNFLSFQWWKFYKYDIWMFQAAVSIKYEDSVLQAGVFPL